MTAPYYADDTVTVHHGDCLDILATLPDASVDAVVTDPPYNLSFMAKPWDAYDGREDAGFAYWLSGLIDGEGHFAIKGHSRGTFAPAFALKMRADERGTLERIKRSLGVGTIADEKREPNPMVKYVIQDKAGCQRLVDLLDKYPLRAKKQVDYWSWREAVCEWTARPRGNRWHGRADTARMEGLRGRLMANRAYTDVPWSGHEFQDWCRLWGAECLRILKPGGHLLSFGGTRTSHRLTAGLEDAGFEIRDSIAWLYGSGFPKSLDVSKAIDKAAGAEREAPPGRHAVALSEVAIAGNNRECVTCGRQRGGQPTNCQCAKHTAPATDSARTWQGWGTALKPAHEPVVVARKPLAGTVAGNVLAHGTGALNVDGCRVEAHDSQLAEKYASVQNAGPRANSIYGADDRDRAGASPHPAGRWPANVVLDESQAAALDQMSGEIPSHGGIQAHHARNAPNGNGLTMGHMRPPAEAVNHVDTGGASRFFYTAKADAAERVRLPKPGSTGQVAGTPGRTGRECNVCGNRTVPKGGKPWPACGHEDWSTFTTEDRSKDTVAHPTVKPLALMRWLVRLVTPPGGLVLEPFAGSGTTVEACILEGFRCVAIEREADYLPLILQRIHRRRDPVAAVLATAEDGGLFDLLDDEQGA